MEIRTWRSAIADLKWATTAGSASSALREGTPGWVWRCDAAISRYHKKKPAFLRACFYVQPKHQNGAIFVQYRRLSAMFEQAELRGTPSTRILLQNFISAQWWI